MFYFCLFGLFMWLVLLNGEILYFLCGYVGNFLCGFRNNKLDYFLLCGLYEVIC